MRVLVFGDSHAACLIEAWRAAPPPGWQMAFFVRPGSGPPEHSLTGSRIAAATPAFRQVLDRLGQPAEHDLAAQDAFVVIGGGLSLFPLVQVLNLYDVLDWEGTTGRDPRPALTESVLARALDEAFAATAAARVMADLRALPELADRPIHLLPQPLPSERVLTDRSAPAGAGLRRMARHRQAGHAARLFGAGAAALAARFGARLHAQPADTIAHKAFTAQAFTTEARRLVNLSLSQPRTDILHANAAYGARLLRAITG